jgi:hypothetical protein
MSNSDSIKFSQTVDFYWRSIAIYAVVLLVCGIIFGSIEGRHLSLRLDHPVVLLLAAIIAGSSVPMMYRIYRKREIIISGKSITFSSRFREKTYSENEIRKISLGKKKIFRSKRKYGVIKIWVKGKKRPVVIRPSSFDDDITLENAMLDLKRKIEIDKN